MTDDPNALTSAELSDLADSLVDALSKSTGRDANRGIRATVQTVHEQDGLMEVIIDGDETSTVLPIESGAIGAQPGDRAYVKLEGREAYVASFRAKDATDRVRVLQEQIEDVVPEFDELNKSIAQGQRDMAKLKSEQEALKKETPTKVEVAQTIDKAKGEILTTIDGQYASEDDLKTLATKTEVELGLEGIRTEVSNNYMNKGDAANLATKTELQQTADSITLTAQGAMDKAEVLEDDLTKNYATKSELSVESGRISGVVSDVTDIGQRTSTLEQRSDGFSVSILQAQQAADDAAKVATNYLDYSADNGLVIARQGATLDDNVQIKPGAVNIRSGETTNASFTSNKISLGLNGADSVIDFCNGLGEVNYHLKGDIENGVGTGIQLSGTLGAAVSCKGPQNGQNAVVDTYSGNVSIYGTGSVNIGSNSIYISPRPTGALTAKANLSIGTSADPGRVNVNIGNGEFAGHAWNNLDNNWTGTLTKLVDILNSWECAHNPASNNLNDLKRAGLFWWQPSTAGIPASGTWGVGISLSNATEASGGTWAIQIGATTQDTSALWMRKSINNGAWTAWKQVGHSDSGWNTFSSGGWNGGYRKVDQFVHLTVQSANTTSSGWITCPVTLPAGYRPSMFSGRDCVQGAAYGNDIVGNNVSRWWVGTNGQIMVAHYGGVNTWVDFTTTYYAG